MPVFLIFGRARTMTDRPWRLGSWLLEDNVLPLAVEIAFLVGYAFDELDSDALDVAALLRGEPRSCSLPGKVGHAALAFSHEPGTGIVDVEIEVPTRNAAEVAVAIRLMQEYSLVGQPGWLDQVTFPDAE